MAYEKRNNLGEGAPITATAESWIAKADELARIAEAGKKTAASISALVPGKKRKKPGAQPPYTPPPAAPSEGLFGIPWMYVGLGGVVLLGGAFFILRR